MIGVSVISEQLSVYPPPLPCLPPIPNPLLPNQSQKNLENVKYCHRAVIILLLACVMTLRRKGLVIT